MGVGTSEAVSIAGIIEQPQQSSEKINMRQSLQFRDHSVVATCGSAMMKVRELPILLPKCRVQITSIASLTGPWVIEMSDIILFDIFEIASLLSASSVALHFEIELQVAR